jgi:hypothetical protein
VPIGEAVRRWRDLGRIERQQILIGRLLEDGYDFLRALVDPTLVAMSSATALQSLALDRSREGWASRTYPKVEPVTIDGRKVLVRRRARWLPRRASKDGR